jgi:hypothetical protein
MHSRKQDSTAGLLHVHEQHQQRIANLAAAKFSLPTITAAQFS